MPRFPQVLSSRKEFAIFTTKMHLTLCLKYNHIGAFVKKHLSSNDVKFVYLGVPSICVLMLSDISAMLLSLRHAAIVQKVLFSRIKPTSKVKPNC